MLTAGAWAQGSQTVGASASSAAPTAKETRKANRALKRQVYAALAKHKEIEAGNISIVAKDGAVTLNGTVTDASQIDTVGEVARNVRGVKSVTNRLSVARPLGE
nr:BON domain-containing protein [Burkholderia pyrrocinia]